MKNAQEIITRTVVIAAQTFVLSGVAVNGRDDHG